jgi:hypothetical protein
VIAKVAAVGAYIAMLLACSAAFEFGPADIVVSDPNGFVREALILIAKQAPAGPDDHVLIDDAHLPESLRIAKVTVPRRAFLTAVREVYVGPDHLDVVLIRHTDGHAGARVWSHKSRPHLDSPTRYKDIYSFIYDKERPTSADNIP